MGVTELEDMLNYVPGADENTVEMGVLFLEEAVPSTPITPSVPQRTSETCLSKEMLFYFQMPLKYILVKTTVIV